MTKILEFSGKASKGSVVVGTDNRDTFISEQVGKGVPSAVVAKWCDTSERVINSVYLDGKILEHLRPL